MKLSSSTEFLIKSFGVEKAVSTLIEAGFDAIDFSFPDKEFCELPSTDAFYKELRKRTEEKGIFFNQAHAPSPSSYIDEQKSEVRFSEIVTSMRRAAYLGAKNIVVHPCQHLNYADRGNPDKLFESNMKFYRRLIPYCEEYGIKVAVENMWQYPGMISHSTCSRPVEFINYIDELKNDSIVGCLDIGHAVLVREMPDDFILALGKERLACLHIHDVDGIDDLHTAPFFGITDWKKVMAALATIDYSGDFTFEADYFFEGKPLELIPQYVKLLEQTGRYLIGLFQQAKIHNG